ncbi:MAG: DUF554 domain-containing protein [Clostridiales bacterium]|nr:DUF554 domain-containing protein [Clostridiales bacterium]
MILTGSLVNGAAIVVGAAVGLLAKNLLTEKLKKAIMAALALFTIGLAIPGLMDSSNALVPILSMVLGTVLGEWIDLDRRITALGDRLQSGLKRDQSQSSLAEGFVAGSVLFAVGAMAILGGMKSGLSGDHSLLFAKSVIDGIGALVFAATLGIGVAFSGVTVLVAEGSVAILASLIAPYLGQAVINEISFVGSLLMIGLGLNLLGVTKLKILNMVPAVLLPILLCLFL